MLIPVLKLSDEVRLLYHSMVRLGELIHEGGGVTLPMRAVLECLDHHGPATVPSIARDRGVSRQHIQVIVNDLAAADLVGRHDNPSHQRSRLVALTPLGQTTITDIVRREAELLAPATADLDPSDLTAAADTLSALGIRLENLSHTLESRS